MSPHETVRRIRAALRARGLPTLIAVELLPGGGPVLAVSSSDPEKSPEESAMYLAFDVVTTAGSRGRACDVWVIPPGSPTPPNLLVPGDVEEWRVQIHEVERDAAGNPVAYDNIVGLCGLVGPMPESMEFTFEDGTEAKLRLTDAGG